MTRSNLRIASTLGDEFDYHGNMACLSLNKLFFVSSRCCILRRHVTLENAMFAFTPIIIGRVKGDVGEYVLHILI